MRKKSILQERVCERCGEKFVPTGHAQRFCVECKKINHYESSMNYFHRKFPNSKPKTKTQDVCCVCGDPFASHFDGKPYCNKHYLRMLNNGTIEPKTRVSKNEFSINGEIVTGVTSKGTEFIFDSDEYEKVSKYSWCLSKTNYLVANIKGKVIKLHRYILSAAKGTVIDHINGNTLDNRKSNLRFCSQKDNARNTNAKGVSLNKKTNKWRARIYVDRKEICLGTYSTYEEAYQARSKGEIKYFGEYSPHKSRKVTITSEVNE